MFGKILETTGTLLILSLVLYNSDAFGTVVKASSDAYIGAVKALVGR